MSALPLLAAALLAPPAYPFEATVVGSGPPVIFVPGLGCSGKVWDGAVEHFKGTHECHVLTLAGFAGVKPLPADAPYLDAVAAGVVRYARDRKLAKPAVVGHSLGATVALKAGILGGADVGPVVLVDGFPCVFALFKPDMTADQLKAAGAAERARIEKLPRAEYLADLRTMFGDWLAGDRLEAAMGWLAASDRGTLARAKGELFASDLRAEVGKCHGPVTVLLAYDPVVEKFGVTRDQFVGRAAEQVKGAKRGAVVVRDGVKHFVMYDAPAWTHEQIRRAVGGK